MISRRQLMFSGAAGTLAPGLASASDRPSLCGITVVQLSALQKLHPDVRQGLHDRIGGILPAAAIALSSNVVGDRFFVSHPASANDSDCERAWRFIHNIDDSSPSLLRGAVALCCDRLSHRLDDLAVLRFGQGCSFAGLTVLQYVGAETTLVLILQSARYGFRPDALVLNS